MYKNKLKAWGIAKYMKADQAEALAKGDSADEVAQRAIRSISRRNARAKQTTRTHGRAESNASEEPAPDLHHRPSTTLSVTPPVLAPHLNSITSTSYVTEPSPIQTDQRPFSPPHLERRDTLNGGVVDQFLVNLLAWTHEAYISGHWERSNSTANEKGRHASRKFASDLQAGSKWYEQGKMDFAWIYWRAANRHFQNKDLFKTWYHETPVRLLFEIARIKQVNPVYAKQLLENVEFWADSHLEETDKRYALYKLYGKLNVNELQEIYELAARRLLEGLSSRLDENDPLLFEVRLNRALDMIWFNSQTDLKKWLPSLEKVDSALGARNAFSVYYLLLQAYQQASFGDNAGVQATALEIRRRIEDMPEGNLDPYKLGMAYRRLARAQYQKQCYGDARRSFNTALKYLKGGKHADSIVVEILQCQEHIAKANQDPHEAEIWTQMIQEQERKLREKEEEEKRNDMLLLQRYEEQNNIIQNGHLGVNHDVPMDGASIKARSPSPNPLSRRGTL